MIPWARISLLVSLTFLLFGLLGLVGPQHVFITPVVFHQPVYLVFSFLILVFAPSYKVMAATLVVLFATGTVLDPMFRIYMELPPLEADWPHYTIMVATFLWAASAVARLFSKQFGRPDLVNSLATLALITGVLMAQFSGRMIALIALCTGCYVFYFFDRFRREKSESDIALQSLWLLVGNLELMKVLSFA